VTSYSVTKIHDIIVDLKKYVPSFILYSSTPPLSMTYKKFPFFKNNTNGNNADSIEANYEFVPNDKRSQSYQRLRFDIDAPIEFLKHVMSDLKKPELETEPAKPEPTGLDLINSLEFGLYEENLAKVRRYNDYVTNTSLNEMHSVHLMNHIKIAIGTAFSKLYYSKFDILGLPANVEENL